MRGIKPFGFALLLIQGWALGMFTQFTGELVLGVDGHFHQEGGVHGKARRSSCVGKRRAPFLPDGKVALGGTVSLKGAVISQEGPKRFPLHAWGSKTETGSQEPQHSHHNQQSQRDPTSERPMSSPEVLAFPTLWFPQSPGNPRRRKRDWVIPPINIPENDRGPFPKTMVQIRSSNAKKMEITYNIMGPGADQAPEGIFSIDKRSGMLFVTKPLDREKKASYVLLAQAVAVGIGQAEQPMELVIRVMDQNDNKPEFTHNPFLGHVTEGALPDSAFMKVTAIDRDDPLTDNGIVRYKIVSQVPQLPSRTMFAVNAVSGVVSVSAAGLDRETYPEYKLVIEAADMEGIGLTNTGTAIITVTDTNDNAPQFVNSTHSGTVRENDAGALVLKMAVTDKDEPHTPAWSTKYVIVEGNEGGLFSVSAGPGKLEGIISTAKGLDFENRNKHTLLVTVENDAAFSTRLPTSTATVTVTVGDVNEAPAFMPPEKVIKVSEGSPVGGDLTEYTAKDPDSAMKQAVRFRIEDDPARWLSVNKETGLVTVRRPMDRESSFVKDGKYKAIILAYDDDDLPATGTGTLIIDLDDVNDNPPLLHQREVSICAERPEPARLDIIDADGPGNAGPFDVELLGESRSNWTAKVNSTSDSVIDLTLRRMLDPGLYLVLLRIYDAGQHFQDSTVSAAVCQCEGRVSTCVRRAASPYAGAPLPIGVLGAVLGLLLLGLLLLMFMRRRSRPKKGELLLPEDVRDNLYYYDEEGGGEEDQEYDLSQLHRGLDDRPEVFRNDVAPGPGPLPLYRPRPQEDEEIGDFIQDNLKAADSDPTAPPYDSLLVFDYEGGGSEAGSLSSLNSSSSGDQDYDRLAEWGPRFRKLADMYGSGEDCDSDTLPGKVEWV